MRNISWCPCLNTRLNPNPRINNADRAVVKCKEVWAFTKECHTYFYHSSVHCQGINIPIAISNILFFGKIGGTLWRKIRNTFLQKIPVPMMTRVPVVCAVWWCDVCTAVGLSCAAGKLWVTTPGSTIWIEYQCGKLLMPRRLLRSGILEYFYAQNFAIHFAFTEKIWIIKHPLPLQYPSSIWFDLWNSTFTIIYPIHYINQHYLKNQYILHSLILGRK